MVERLIQLVGLAYPFDSAFDLPEVLAGDIVSQAGKLALKANARGVEWAWLLVMPWSTTLRADVVVIVTEVPGSVVKPSTDRVDEARGIEAAHHVCECKLRVVRSDLAPAFVVDFLKDLLALLSTRYRLPKDDSESQLKQAFARAYPCKDRLMIPQLRDHDFQLPFPLRLLRCIRHTKFL